LVAFGVERSLSSGHDDSAGENLQDHYGFLACRWKALSLCRRFMITAAIVIAIGMTVLGAWVSDRIAHGVIHASATNAALYLTSFLEPHVQELATGDALSEPARQQIEATFRRIIGQSKVIGIKIWARGGRLAYSSDGLRTGGTFPESEALRQAWAGSIEAEYDELSGAESEMERRLGLPLLEVYTPMRETATNEVVAVAEIYEIADRLSRDLRASYLQSVLVVGSLALVMIGSLYHIVSRGSQTIDRQRAALAARIEELSRLLQENRKLQRHVAQANRRAVETNEHLMRRVGAELHDGPAQAIGFALLRLDALRPRLAAARAGAATARTATAKPAGASPPDDIDMIHGALRDGLTELRAVCHGLAIPELVDATFPDAIRGAVRNHQFRTRTEVELVLADDLPVTLDMPLLTCLYRLVQEGLNNAYRHAKASGQRVEARVEGDRLRLVVSDTGGGLSVAVRDGTSLGGLGLCGLKHRILSLGGDFEVASTTGCGVRLTASFRLDAVGGADG
jgi:signal transduction histidine kinase